VVAWGHDAVASELRLATAGGGQLSLHSINPRAAVASHYEFPLPAELVAGPLRSCCFLEQSPDRIAVTGDACRCAVLQLEAAAKVERIVQLRAPGVAVRAHSREPQQLMIAQEDGQVHFVDLRVPGGRPSLSRGLPPSSLDSGGLRDADWSPADYYLVGGVCGARWVAWDLRQAGLSPPPQSGDSQPSGALAFRWHPHSPHFATAGAAGGVHVHTLQQPDLHVHGHMPSHAAPSAYGEANFDVTLAHELPTRVGSISWLHTRPAMLVGAADTKVCVWAVGAGAQQHALL